MSGAAQKSKDRGLGAVRDLHAKLQIEPEWCLWDERGFTWWGKDLAQRIERYRQHDLTDEQVHDIVIRSVDAGVLPNRKLPNLLKEWREPSREEFSARNAWSLFNSYTEVLKGNLAELPRRTERLHGLLDSEIGWWAN